MTDKEWKGRWWLPNAADAHLGGELQLSPSVFTLSLDGDLLPAPLPPANGGPMHIGIEHLREPLILGSDRSGEDITLLDCERTRLTIPAQPSVTEWHPTAALAGVHISNTNELRFSAIECEFDYLIDWIAIKSLGHTVESDEVDGLGSRVEIVLERDIVHTAHLDAALIELRVNPDWHIENDEAEAALRAKFRVELSEPIGWREALSKWIAPLEALVYLGTLRANRLEAVRLAQPQETDGPRQWFSLEFRSIDQKRPHRSEARIHPAEMAFTASQMPQGFETGVKRWFEGYDQYSSVLELTTGVEAAPFLYGEQGFLSYAQAIEILHRIAIGGTPVPKDEHKGRVAEVVNELEDEELAAWADEILRKANWLNLRARLVALVQDLEPEIQKSIVGSSTDLFVARVVETRNYLTHRDEKTKNVLEGEALFWHSQALLWILRYQLLTRVLDFDSADISKRFSTNNRFATLVNRLAEI
jgi:hypothetical protein